MADRPQLNCLVCGNPVGIFRTLRGRPFCSDQHESMHGGVAGDPPEARFAVPDYLAANRGSRAAPTLAGPEFGDPSPLLPAQETSHRAAGCAAVPFQRCTLKAEPPAATEPLAEPQWAANPDLPAQLPAVTIRPASHNWESDARGLGNQPLPAGTALLLPFRFRLARFPAAPIVLTSRAS